MSKPKRRRCRDCPTGSVRPAPHEGPRCATHWRTERQRRAQAHRDTYVARTYGITADEARALIEYQGGVCAICGWATGRTRRLSFDHQHRREGCDHAPETACKRCLRGSLCRPCNDFLGYIRDDPAALARGYWYLIEPPARALFRGA